MIEENDNLDDSDYKPNRFKKDKPQTTGSLTSKPKEKKKKKKEKKKKQTGSESDQDDSDFADAGSEENEGSEDEDGLDYKDEDKEMIVRYFNKLKLEEFQSLLTSKKLDVVISLRPFRNFGELVS